MMMMCRPGFKFEKEFLDKEFNLHKGTDYSTPAKDIRLSFDLVSGENNVKFLNCKTEIYFKGTFTIVILNFFDLDVNNNISKNKAIDWIKKHCIVNDSFKVPAGAKVSPAIQHNIIHIDIGDNPFNK